MTQDELYERKYSFQDFLEWRGIPDLAYVCKTCSGSGVRAYPNTSLWSGGIGGDMISSGTCDTCWGSGNKESPGPNLRVIHSKLSQLPKTP